MSVTIASFGVFLAAFVGIGVLSSRRKRSNADDYLLASRDVSSWLTALSAVSTNNSGFMFIGLIGATYKTGVSSAWLMVGWIAGDYLAWLWVHRRLRVQSEVREANTIPAFVGGGDRLVVTAAALVTLCFLGTYAAAQLSAGSKALHVLFGWEYGIGAVIGAVIVLVYCFSGGIRASIWTDAAQAVVMLISMVTLIAVALGHTGGISGLFARLEAIDPRLVEVLPRGLTFGFGPYLLGWLGAGLGVVGQPHIMIRAMAIRSGDAIGRARRIYFTWYVAFTACAIGVGLACRVLLRVGDGFDAELALPSLSIELLPPWLVGLILAGLFSATMSTADSQVLSCSAAVTQDIFPGWGTKYGRLKLGTALVVGLVLAISLGADKGVFQLVVLAWSALASSLGPLLMLRVLGVAVGRATGAAMIAGGLGGVLVWRYGLGLSGALYDVLPGMLSGLAIFLVSRLTARLTSAGA